MAQPPAAIPVKRGPGRPPKAAALLQKKQKTSISTPSTVPSPLAQSPAVKTPEPEIKAISLPIRITDDQPLPTLPEPQPLQLSNDVYQSYAVSDVLSTCLDRSRSAWISSGVFERFWVKPETGKHAKPPPPGNPDAKLMKLKGPCRLRIEPHILEADIYVEEKAKLSSTSKQYVPGQINGVQGQSHNRPPGPTQHNWQHQTQPQGNPSLPPTAQANPAPPQRSNTTLPPIQNDDVSMTGGKPTAEQLPTPPPQGATPQPAPPPAAPDKKPTQDPVISMLAARASSDSQLKALMKEVATGNASQDQLRIFQRHIDELSAIVARQKREQEEQAAFTTQKSHAVHIQQPTNVTAPSPAAGQHPLSQSQPQYQKHHPGLQTPNLQYEQPIWAPAPPQPPPLPPSLPVILAFTTPGATEDRFLFPQSSILEPLSPQHTLATFIVTRRGSDAVDASGLEPDTEYWQPITLMVEVAYGREEILKCIRRWVKPADDARKDMLEIMRKAQRMPDSFLALRLPFASAAAREDDSNTEVASAVEEKHKLKSALKQGRKSLPTGSSLVGDLRDDAEKAGGAKPKNTDVELPPAVAPNADASTTVGDVIETDRPRRRKSVRITEG